MFKSSVGVSYIEPVAKTKTSPILRYVLLQKWQFRCAWCGQPLLYENMEGDHLVPEWLAGQRLAEVLRGLGLPDDYDLQSTRNRAPLCRNCNNRLKGPRPPRFLPAISEILERAELLAPDIDAEVARVLTRRELQGVAKTVLKSVASPEAVPGIRRAAEEFVSLAGGPLPTYEPFASPGALADSPRCSHCFSGVAFCPDCWDGSRGTGHVVEAEGRRHPYPSFGATLWAKGAEPTKCPRCEGLGAIRCPFCCGTGKSGWEPRFQTGDLVTFDPSATPDAIRPMVGLVQFHMADGRGFRLEDWLGCTFEVMDFRIPILQASGPAEQPQMGPADVAYALATVEGPRRIVAYALGQSLSLVMRPEPYLRLK
jgi:hypothetical protein